MSYIIFHKNLHVSKLEVEVKEGAPLKKGVHFECYSLIWQVVRNIFHCLSCGRASSIIDFKYENKVYRIEKKAFTDWLSQNDISLDGNKELDILSLALEALSNKEKEVVNLFNNMTGKSIDLKEENFEIISFGVLQKGVLLRKGENQKTTSGTFFGTRHYPTINLEELRAFGMCGIIHTDQSVEEISTLLNEIYLTSNGRKLPNGKVVICGNTHHRLWNNIIALHNELPGEEAKKTSKIYWSERLEKILIPHFMKNENVPIDDLVFATIEGDLFEKAGNGEAPFQGENLKPQEQLQFIGIGKEKIFAELKKEIRELQNNDLIPELKNPSDNPLLRSAQEYTHLVAYRDSLKSKQINDLL